MRCERHALACGPDGLCALCRREPARGAPGRTLIIIGLAAAAAMLGAGVVRYRVLMARNAPPPVAVVASPVVEMAPAPLSPGVRPASETRERAPENPTSAPAPAAPGASAEVEPEVQARRVAPDPISIGDVEVIVYTASWCSVCRRAKSWMNAKGIAYDERDIESSSEYMRQIKAINPRASIPTFDIEGTVLVGFSEDGLVRAMQRVARLRAERRNY